MSLKGELHVILGAVFAIALAALGVASARGVGQFYRVEVVEAKGRAMARALAGPCAQALAQGRPGELEKFLVDQKTAPPDAILGAEVDLLEIAVLDEKKKVLAALPVTLRSELEGDPFVERAAATGQLIVIEGSDRPGRAETPKALPRFGPHGEAIAEFFVPLREGSRTLGTLFFALSLERAWGLYATTLAAILGGGALAAAVIWFTLYKMLKRSILAPILELSRAVERVRQGDLGAHLERVPNDEIGALMGAFNEMMVRLRERAEFAQKLDEAERLQEAHRRLAEIHRELAEAHTALKATQDQLIVSEKHASLGRLVQAVAHEINNPLGAASAAVPPLMTALDRLSAGIRALPGLQGELEDLDDIARSCAVIERGVERAVAIVRDLRAFSRLSADDLAQVDLRRVVEEAVEACAADLGTAEKRVQVDLDIASQEGGPISLRAFPTLLRQVFVNLVSNAAQAIPGKGRVSIAAHPRGDRVRIEVRDDGRGIRPEHLPRLFEPFFTTKEAGRGTGLGLTLCHSIVEKHGGTIEAASDYGHGATFTIELPLVARIAPAGSPNVSSLLEGRGRDASAVVATRGRLG